jgi:hypothetical protein
VLSRIEQQLKGISYVLISELPGCAEIEFWLAACSVKEPSAAGACDRRSHRTRPVPQHFFSYSHCGLPFDCKHRNDEARVKIRELGIAQSNYVSRVSELNSILDRARLEDFTVSNENRSVIEVAEEMLTKAGWISR